MANPAADAHVARLCPACGLCCDSTLFADVELRLADDPQKLAKQGLTLSPKGRGKLAFAQPCPAFDGQLCGIYADRPVRCRQFHCGLLQRVEAKKMTPAAALKIIAIAKKQAGEVRRLLVLLGQKDERRALTHRYAEAMSAPLDLANPEQAELHGTLMLRVSDLMHLLQRHFLQ